MTDDANELMSCLQRFTPRSEAEARDVETVMALARADDAWSRSAAVHITASALIVHPPTRRVLLRWHDRQQAWLQVGGHADPGEVDPLAVAMREGTEETGLDDLTPWPHAELQHVVIVPVPANDREPAHHHADLRFLLKTDQPDHARPEHATAALQWLSVGAALDLTGEDNVRELIVVARDLFG